LKLHTSGKDLIQTNENKDYCKKQNSQCSYLDIGKLHCEYPIKTILLHENTLWWSNMEIFLSSKYKNIIFTFIVYVIIVSQFDGLGTLVELEFISIVH